MKKAKYVLCLILLFVAFSFYGCAKSANSLVYEEITQMGNISEVSLDKSIYVQNKSKNALTKISRSDMAVLYFDKENYSVSVYDYGAKKLWNCLPQFYEGGTPSVISVDVLCDNELYTFNSQTDSVMKNKASYEILDDSVIITYTFDGTTKSGKNITFSVPVYFAVTDGVMTVSIDAAKIDTSSFDGKTRIKDLHLLNYFGSSTDGSEGDYILIPDGCGAVIDTAEKAQKFQKIVLPVYSNAENEANVFIGAFGVKNQESGFCALIESGDAISYITAEKALESGMYNKVGASFELTQCLNSDEKTYVSSETYLGEIRITYKFVSGDRANYVGMASSIREALIRNGTLKMEETAEESTSIPFVLSVLGSEKSDKGGKTVLTSFSQAQDILSLYRSKGISNIALRYEKMTDEKNIDSALGGKSERETFLEYTDLHNIDVYPTFDLLSDSNSKNAALALNEESVKLSSSEYFVSPSYVTENTTKLLSSAINNSFGAMCISDAGKYLYGDFSSSSYADRQSVKNIVFSQFSALSSLGSLMIEGANIYSVKYADYVLSLPTSCSVSKTDSCESVPFVQSILHGLVTYTTSPLNLNDNTETALLKAAEYGAVPYFEVYYSDNSTEDKKDLYNYISCASLAQEDYERLSNTFDLLQNKKITNHYKVKKGVYCTEYSSDISVYVNYNKKDVKVNGVTIEARSFLKVG